MLSVSPGLLWFPFSCWLRGVRATVDNPGVSHPGHLVQPWARAADGLSSPPPRQLQGALSAGSKAPDKTKGSGIGLRLDTDVGGALCSWVEAQDAQHGQWHTPRSLVCMSPLWLL